MEDKIKQDIYYRWEDLLNHNKKIIFQKVRKLLYEAWGYIAIILSQKEKLDEKMSTYTKRIHSLQAEQAPETQLNRRHTTQATIGRTQSVILQILQPKFNKFFDQVASDPSLWGLAYNEDLRTHVWHDIIFGERDISGVVDGSRTNYTMSTFGTGTEERFQQKRIQHIQKIKAERERVWLPKWHVLITLDNVETRWLALAKYMEKLSIQYGRWLGLDIQDSDQHRALVEKYFLYIFIRALIDMRLIFDIKSTKESGCLDLCIDHIAAYFENIFHQPLHLDAKQSKKKLRANLKDQQQPMDIAYDHSLLADIDVWEEYINMTYLHDKWLSANSLRLKIMYEYNAQKWQKEGMFELINPYYHLYKDEQEVYQKQLDAVLQQQKNISEQDERMVDIINDLYQKIAYAKQRQQEYAVFEDENAGISTKYVRSMTEIQQQYLKRYQIPLQYRHVFGVVMNKLNNYYQTTTSLIKKANQSNQELLDNLICSEQRGEDVLYYLQNYITQKQIQSIVATKRSDKRTARHRELKEAIHTAPKAQLPAQTNQLWLVF